MVDGPLNKDTNEVLFYNKLLLDVIVQVDKAKIGIEYDIEICNTKELYTIFV